MKSYPVLYILIVIDFEMKLDIKFHIMRNGSILNLKEIGIKLVQYVLNKVWSLIIV